MRIGTLALLLMLAGCGGYPRDISGTFDRVGTQHLIRVGLVAGTLPPRAQDRITAYLARLRAETGAAVRSETGAAEPLLARLEGDELDLVIGEFAEDSPWIADAAIVEPLATREIGGRRIGLSPVARNGENRWIMLLERNVRALGGAR